VTYWLEAMRRAVLPEGVVRSLPGLTDGAVLEGLMAATTVWALLGGLAFVAGLGRARQKGILDAGTMF